MVKPKQQRKRQSYTGKEKFDLVLKILKGEPAAQVAADSQVNAVQLSKWKNLLLEKGCFVFDEAPASDSKEPECACQCEALYSRIGKQQIEIESLRQQLSEQSLPV